MTTLRTATKETTFSRAKMFLTAYVLISSIVLKLKTEGQKIETMKSYKSEIKILVFSGLA